MASHESGATPTRDSEIKSTASKEEDVFFDIHGGAPGSYAIRATGTIESVDSTNRTFVLSGFEEKVAEKVGARQLTFESPNHPTGGITFEELRTGMKVAISFIWPRESALSGVVTLTDGH